MEIFNLNMIPGEVAPVIHASQYDDGREFRANLFEGENVYNLTGAETISVNVRKPDGNVVTAAVTNTGDSYVEFATTEQMTACAGANLCELKIENSPVKIGSLNFILSVEADPLEGGIESESEINNLETQVAGFVAQEVAEQYDSANVIFDNTPTPGHGNGYTVTSEGIKTALDQKANTLDIPANGDFNLAGLGDTSITSPTAGQELKFDGSKWVNVSTAKTEITSNVTFIENITGTNTRVYEKGGVVYIYYQGENKTHAAGDDLFTLPSGYRPQNLIYQSIVINNTGYGNISLNNDGACKISQVANGSTSGRVYFSLAFPI